MQDFEKQEILLQITELKEKIKSSFTINSDIRKFFVLISGNKDLKQEFQSRVKQYNNLNNKVKFAMKFLIKIKQFICEKSVNSYIASCHQHIVINSNKPNIFQFQYAEHIFENILDKKGYFDINLIDGIINFYNEICLSGFVKLSENARNTREIIEQRENLNDIIKILDLDISKYADFKIIQFFKNEKDFEKYSYTINTIVKISLLKVLNELYSFISALNEDLNNYDAIYVQQNFPIEYSTLTKTEKNIIPYILKELSAKEIADTKGNSINTINKHISNIASKFNVEGAKGIIKKIKNN